MGGPGAEPTTVPEGPRLGDHVSKWHLAGASSSSTASPPRTAGTDAQSEEEISHVQFDDWVLQVWRRMDRDHSGAITRQELNCDEFHVILKSVIVPANVATTSVTYARSEMHVMQAMNFCLRKADINNDGVLSFKEFKTFMRMLGSPRLGRERTNLIFALFDLDGTSSIDKEEFRGICRYYLGHHPTVPMLEAEWAKLDQDEKGYAALADYSRWLRTSASPIFRQFAQAVSGEPSDEELRRLSKQQVDVDTAQGLLAFKRQKDRVRGDRPEWNESFNQQDSSKINEASPPPRRMYLSRPQSLPELKRYLDRHSTKFADQRRFYAQKPVPEPRRILSDDTPALPMLLPERYVPGGTMRKKGKTTEWMDAWQAPKCITHGGLAGRISPGSLTLRVAGRAPAWLARGKDVDSDEEEQEAIAS